jgi:hypothetical protein
VPIAINTGLTSIPLWGTDIGGFVPTRELKGERFVRLSEKQNREPGVGHRKNAGT